MTLSATIPPSLDPTCIFELFRGNYGSELLTAAVAHFNVFGILSDRELALADFRQRLDLAERPAIVLTTALRAMGLLDVNDAGQLCLTPLAEQHLVPGADFSVADYIGLAASSPGVLEMVERLRTNRPAGSDDQQGAAFIYREGIASAMEQEELARHFTLALAGRAKNVAPVLAERVSLESSQTLLDVGGGTAIYSIALLQRNANLRAIVLDRPEVLKIANEFAEAYGVQGRLDLLEGDMFATDLPVADTILLSNVLHDWDVPECRQLVARCAKALPPNGRLLIHDVLLNDDLRGPLPIALYSAALFQLTEGRAYSGAEFRSWLAEAGLTYERTVDTLVHCAAIVARKP